MKCGREPGGANAATRGICPASNERRADGINGGMNGGRACWAIAGTFCKGVVSGSSAAEFGDCRACSFFRTVQKELCERGSVSPESETRIIDLLLERTALLENEILQRKLAEERLQEANDKLILLADISRHDILNKLNAISLMSELLIRNAPGNPDLAGYAGKIRSHLDSVTEMVRLTGEYQDAGTHLPSWQAIPNLIPEILAGLGDVPFELDPYLENREIYADPLLGKVFYNLADNTIRHGETVTRVKLYLDRRRAGPILIWEDDGWGIPETEKKSIFQRGYGKNTGLGLFLSGKILSRTGISIQETGIFGKGSRFEISIPESAWRTKT